MACLVMEIFPLATWSLYSFTFSWLLTRKQTTASLAEKGLGSIARMPPPQWSPSMLPPNLFRKVFGALIKNLKLLSGLKGLNPLCFLASLHPLLAVQGLGTWSAFGFSFLMLPVQHK